MGAPGLVPGGRGTTTGFEAGTKFFDAKQALPGEPTGIFAPFPGSTPKYALNRGQKDAEGLETMARMFIQMAGNERKDFVKSLPPETRTLGKVLAGPGTRSGGGLGFVDFLLTRVDEQFQEKVQIVESLSDNFIVYTFGQKAPMFSYSGVAMNTYQDDQRVWLMRLYRDVLRGTQLARRRKLVRLRYDSVIVSGIFVAHGQTLEGSAANYANFSFSLIPTQYVIFTPTLGSPVQAQTAFTEGAQYGLNSAGAPDNTRKRSVTATRGTQSKAPAAQKTASNLTATDKRLVDKEKALRALEKRTGATNKQTKQAIPNTYGAPPATGFSPAPEDFFTGSPDSQQSGTPSL